MGIPDFDHVVEADHPNRVRSRPTRAEYAYQVQKLLRPLLLGEGHDLELRRKQILSKLLSWVECHVDLDFADTMRRLLEQSDSLLVPATPSPAFDQLSSPKRKWADFFLEQAAIVNAAVNSVLTSHQTKTLDELTSTMFSLNQPEFDSFAPVILRSVPDLITLAPQSAGIIVLRRQIEDDGSSSLRVDKAISMEFRGAHALQARLPKMSGWYDSDHPKLEISSLMHLLVPQRVFKLDVPTPSFKTLRPFVPGLSPDTPFTICPIFAAGQLDSEDDDIHNKILGFLWIMLPRDNIPGPPYIDTLHRLSVIAGQCLDYMERITEYRNWASDLTHDLSKSLRVLVNQVRAVDSELNESLDPGNLPEAQELTRRMHDEFRYVKDLVFLTNNLLHWSMDFAGADNFSQSDDMQPLDCARLLAELERPIATYARLLTGRAVHWQVGDATSIVVAPENARHLIKAVLFKFIENALKYGSHADITVSLTESRGHVMFEVTSIGSQVPVQERGHLFERGFRGANNFALSLGQGLGLGQVKRIAATLSAEVGYRPQGKDCNIFWLRLPRNL